MVHLLEKDVQSTKTNVESMNELMSQWSLSGLYDRKDGKKDTLLNLEVMDCIINCNISPHFERVFSKQNLCRNLSIRKKYSEKLKANYKI